MTNSYDFSSFSCSTVQNAALLISLFQSVFFKQGLNLAYLTYTEGCRRLQKVLEVQGRLVKHACN